ncbi:MAG: aminoglycoside phosphotransferase, partial [Proteobacteria bacterium]|nr:aminoglycoside phosphotransferase [Pseudomonadota bacterium]
MTERARAISEFLAAAGWADAERRPLAADASFRRYERPSR